MKNLISFESVHHAMEAESYLKSKDIEFKTIPTPREITTSCGLAILLSPLSKDEIEEIKNEIKLENIYYFESLEGNKKKIEKII